jgi:hypothetical protein
LGTIAYAAIGEGGLLILDVSNPERPRRIGGLDLAGDVRHVSVADGFVYLAGGTMGLSIVDVRNPVLASIVGEYSSLTNVNRVVVRGNFAYIADGDTGFQILDVSNKENPVLAAGIPGHAWSVAVEGNYAYVCERTNGLRIVDISTPRNPATSSFYRTNGLYELVFAESVAVRNGYAYLLNAFLTLEVISVTNALSPLLISTTALGNPSFDHIVGELSLDGDTVFVSYGVGEIPGAVGLIDVKERLNPTRKYPYLGDFFSS